MLASLRDQFFYEFEIQNHNLTVTLPTAESEEFGAAN